LKVWKMRRDFDFGVFEVSLGGTGLAEIGVITTIADDYPIAKGTRRAFDGKAQMAVGARRSLVVSEKEKDLWSDLVDEGAEIVTFGDGGGMDVKVSPPLIFDEAAELEIYVDGRKELLVEILGSYLVPSYLPAFSAALATAIEAGAELDDAAKALQSFSGIPGRGDVRMEGGVWLIRERNPGVTASSVDFNLTCLRDYYDLKGIGVVIEPTTKNVCERLEVEELEKVIMKHQDCVSGAYFLHHRGDKKYEGEVFHLIDDISEAGKGHDALLWCTKEGFQ
jgi:UDP-N-acetylmuramyl pentapeptide synthase